MCVRRLITTRLYSDCFTLNHPRVNLLSEKENKTTVPTTTNRAETLVKVKRNRINYSKIFEVKTSIFEVVFGGFEGTDEQNRRGRNCSLLLEKPIWRLWRHS